MLFDIPSYIKYIYIDKHAHIRCTYMGIWVFNFIKSYYKTLKYVLYNTNWATAECTRIHIWIVKEIALRREFVSMPKIVMIVPLGFYCLHTALSTLNQMKMRSSYKCASSFSLFLSHMILVPNYAIFCKWNSKTIIPNSNSQLDFVTNDITVEIKATFYDLISFVCIFFLLLLLCLSWASFKNL